MKKMPTEFTDQHTRFEKLVLTWFLLLAIAIFLNRFTNGGFQFVIESLGIIGFVGFFLTK